MSQTPPESQPVDGQQYDDQLDGQPADGQQLDGQPADGGPVETESTGNAAVDRVVASLDGLDELPVGEHVALFEQAHEDLRRTLNEANAPRPQG